MTLKEKMKKGPVFGMACFSGVSCIIQTIGNYGLDFIYLDLEHTPWTLGSDFEKQIMAAKLSGISILVRMADTDEVSVRKVLEWGADGVVIPHCKNRVMTETVVEAAKFPPLGRRGAESNVRAAGFGGPGFDWNTYIKSQNSDTLIIPMDEDYEFSDNIDDILSVPGIDAVNFGPLDYSNSLKLPVQYGMGEDVRKAFKLLVKKTQERHIGCMGPVIPPTKENIDKAIKDGYNMLILGNDIWHFQNSLKGLMQTVTPFMEKR